MNGRQGIRIKSLEYHLKVNGKSMENPWKYKCQWKFNVNSNPQNPLNLQSTSASKSRKNAKKE